MATHTGSEGVIKSGATTVAEVRSYTISETGDTIEDTSMGDSSRTYKAGLKTFTASVEAFWDETDTTGQGSFDVGSTVTLNVYPEGSTTGDVYYTGSAIVTGKTVNATFDGMVEASFTLQGTGALSETTV
jgi:predicted secreted protein